MARLAIFLGAALASALLALLPESAPPSLEAFWSAASPNLWVDSKIDPAIFQDSGDGFVCPMDRDVNSARPGFCPRCRMKLVPAAAAHADIREYPVRVTSEPKQMKAGENMRLTFTVENSQTSHPVHDFEVVHEKLYHLFVVSQDLSFFQHTHPQLEADSTFQLDLRLPKAGMYRILSDFYPKGGTPQLAANTLLVAGSGFTLQPATLQPQLAPQSGQNIKMQIATAPLHPVAGEKTLISLRLSPNDGIEPYLGAMAHVLAASSDLIDMMHTHPLQVVDHTNQYKELQFNMTFPRAGVYRIWAQSQRKGVVNTVAFNVPVAE